MDCEYLLSICMMVKDEEKNLKRCLDSLKPLLKKKDVELIIVDTGSQDNTVSISKEYTSRVYNHPWENNFSDMRNITISYARGNRIFIMDADEVLLEPELLYELICDYRLKSYNTFIVKTKNFVSSGGFILLPQERVFTNDGEFRYEGSVHNQPKYKLPLLNTDIHIEHYGYLFHDRELMEKKFLRTGGILKAELEKDPDNIYYRFQLARSYNAHGDQKEALDEIRGAYSILSRDKASMIRHVYVYGAYAMICCENNNFDEVTRVCREGMEIQPEYVDLYYVMAVALDRKGDKQGAAEYYKRYIDLAESYDQLKISADRSMEMYYLGSQYQDVASGFVANELYVQGIYEEAYKYVKKIHEIKDKITNSAKILLKTGNLTELRKLYIQKMDDKTLRNSVTYTIEAEKANISPEFNKKIEKAFSTGEDIYSILNKKRCSEDHDDSRFLEQAVKLADFNELPVFYADLFLDVGKNTRHIISIFKKMQKTRVSQYVIRLLEKRESLMGFFEEYLPKENIRPDDIQSLRTHLGIYHALLINEAKWIRRERGQVPDNYNTLFRLYIDRGIQYTALLYNPERLRLYYSMLEDQEDRFFIAMRFAAEAVKKNESKSGIHYFTEAAKANPGMVCYMERYRDELFPDIVINANGEGESHE